MISDKYSTTDLREKNINKRSLAYSSIGPIAWNNLDVKLLESFIDYENLQTIIPKTVST